MKGCTSDTENKDYVNIYVKTTFVHEIREELNRGLMEGYYGRI